MRLKTILKYLIIAVVVFAFAFSTGAVLAYVLNTPGVARQGDKEASQTVDIDGERVNILIMGSDARPKETVARSDSMVLASVDPELKKIVFVFIPRDTKWTSKKYGTNKINAAHAIGGPQLARETVEQLFGVKIDYYVEVDFNGFREIVDAIGGVEVDVKQRMYKEGDYIDIWPGKQVLNGMNAVGYMRYRSYLMGDEERDQAQAVFIKSMAAKMLSPENVVKLPEIIRVINKSMMTDMSLMDMLQLASWAPAFSGDDVITQTLPGWYDNGYDGSGTLISCYWMVDRRDARSILDKLYAGKTFEPLKDTEGTKDYQNPFGDESSGDEESDYRSSHDNDSSDDNKIDSNDKQVNGSEREDTGDDGSDVNSGDHSENGNDENNDSTNDGDSDSNSVEDNGTANHSSNSASNNNSHENSSDDNDNADSGTLNSGVTANRSGNL